MNGKERILAALNIQVPDKVPVWIHAINETAVVNIGKLIAEDVPDAKPVNLLSMEEMQKLLEILFIIHEKLEIDGFTALGLSELMGVKNIDNTRFIDQWGTTWARSPHGIAYMVQPSVESPENLNRYTVPDIHDNEGFMVKLAANRFGNEKAVFFLMRGTFVRSWRIRGMQNLMLDMLERPDFVHELAEMVTEYNMKICRIAAESGADVLIVEDDIASRESTLISPAHFDAFVAPYNKRVLDYAHKLGLKVVRHSDGNLWSILDRLIDMGYDGLNPLEEDAGMSLKKVKDYCGDRICLAGNIDCGELLCNGSEKSVEEAVISAINDAGPGGGYILCSSNSIHPGVNPHNFIAMVNAAKKYGGY
ncbi:MAG: hypothetical protein J7K04_02640 [Spirochaetales bacterium]|nr:hypothetical protein [Spirochaetales bacterium]